MSRPVRSTLRSTVRTTAVIVAGSALVVAACGDPDATSTSSTDVAGLAAPRPITVGATANSTTAGAPASAESADMSIARDIAPISSITFVAGDQLGPLPTDSTGYEFPAGATLDEAAMRAIADALGVRGEMVVLPTEEGGGWRIGPSDGSAPSITVAPTATLDWYYSSAWANEVPLGAPDAMSSSEPGATLGGGVAVAEEPTAAPIETIAPPVGVPTAAAAEAKAREIAVAIGLDPDTFTVTSYGDEYSASASFAGDVAKGTAGRSFDVGFGADAAITWASGQLASPQATGPFPLIELDEALVRLDAQYDWTDQPIGDDVILIDPMPVEPMPADQVSEPFEGDADATTSDANRSDATTIIEPVPVDPALVDPVEGKPVDSVPVSTLEPVDLVVTLTSVKPALWWTSEPDGTVWLLPGYEFTGDDGATYLIAAVADDFLIVEPPLPEPVTEPSVEPPVTEPGVEPPVTDPVVEEPAPQPEPAPDPTDPANEPPATDPVTTTVPEVVVDDSLGLIGLTVDEASTTAGAAGYSVRVVEIDGEPQAVTEDYSPTRINVATVDGLITAILSLG
jgi:hypothetical protein